MSSKTPESPMKGEVRKLERMVKPMMTKSEIENVESTIESIGNCDPFFEGLSDFEGKIVTSVQKRHIKEGGKKINDITDTGDEIVISFEKGELDENSGWKTE